MELNVNPMKLLMLLLIVSLSLVTCKEKDPKPMYNGVASALRNGQPWSAYSGAGRTSESVRGGVCSSFQTVEIGISTYSKEGFWREYLLFEKIPTRLGTYPIHFSQPCWVDSLPGAYYNTLQDDGDVTGDVYKVLESENNYLTVTAVDNTANKIEGAFHITFVIDKLPKIDRFAPDTIRFTEGKFTSKIIKAPQ